MNCGAANEVIVGSAARMQQSEFFSAFGVDGQQEWSCFVCEDAAAAMGIRQEQEPRNRASAAARTIFAFMSTV